MSSEKNWPFLFKIISEFLNTHWNVGIYLIVFQASTLDLVQLGWWGRGVRDTASLEIPSTLHRACAHTQG